MSETPNPAHSSAYIHPPEKYFIFSRLIQRCHIVFDTNILSIPMSSKSQQEAHREDLITGLETRIPITDPRVYSEAKSIPHIAEHDRLMTLVAESRRPEPEGFKEAFDYIKDIALEVGVMGNKPSDVTDVRLAARAYLLPRTRPVLATADHKLCDMILTINTEFLEGRAPACITPKKRLVRPWCMHPLAGLFIPWYGEEDYQARIAYLKETGVISKPKEAPCPA